MSQAAGGGGRAPAGPCVRRRLLPFHAALALVLFFGCTRDFTLPVDTVSIDEVRIAPPVVGAGKRAQIDVLARGATGVSVVVGSSPAELESKEGLRYRFVYLPSGSEPEGQDVVVTVRAAGAVETAVVTGTIRFDFHPPTIETVEVSAARLGPGDTLSLGFSVSEPLASLPQAFLAGTRLSCTETGAHSYRCQGMVPAAAPSGPVRVTVRMEDLAGNEGSGTIESGVVLDTSVSVDPERILLNLDSSASPWVEGLPGAIEAGAEVALFASPIDDMELTQNSTITADPDGAFGPVALDALPGEEVYVEATDAFGNRSPRIRARRVLRLTFRDIRAMPERAGAAVGCVPPAILPEHSASLPAPGMDAAACTAVGGVGIPPDPRGSLTAEDGTDYVAFGNQPGPSKWVSRPVYSPSGQAAGTRAPFGEPDTRRPFVFDSRGRTVAIETAGPSIGTWLLAIPTASAPLVPPARTFHMAAAMQLDLSAWCQGLCTGGDTPWIGLLFGGAQVTPDRTLAPLDDLWAWAWHDAPGGGWRQLTVVSAVRPAPTLLAAMTSMGSRAVLFGGFAGGHITNAIWLLEQDTGDRVRWILAGGAGIGTSPPRAGAAVVWQPYSRRFQLFGGTTNPFGANPTYPDDLLKYRYQPPGAGNSQARIERVFGEPLPGTPRPSGRMLHAMAFDPRDGTTLLFGGVRRKVAGDQVTLEVLGDTWKLSAGGDAWTEIRGTLSPPPTFGHALIFDPAAANGSGGFILLGGYTETGEQRAAWLFDGSEWSLLREASGPGGRVDAALAGHGRIDLECGVSDCSDLAGGELVLFGGRGGPELFSEETTALDDTWRFVVSGGTPRWERISTGTAPPARFGHSLTALMEDGAYLLFGGEAEGGVAGDTWRFAADTWTRLTTMPAPGARAFHAAAAGQGMILLFGGRSATGDFYDDTWQWTGARWVAITTAVEPPARAHHALAYDPNRDVFVLFGGLGVQGVLADTWLFNGAEWTPLTTLRSPSARYDHTLSFDPIRGRIVLFGGRSADGRLLADAWEFTGRDWQRIVPAESPEALAGHSAYHHLFFGGDRTSGLFEGSYRRSSTLLALETKETPMRPYVVARFDTATFDRQSVVRWTLEGIASGLGVSDEGLPRPGLDVYLWNAALGLWEPVGVVEAGPASPRDERRFVLPIARFESYLDQDLVDVLLVSRESSSAGGTSVLSIDALALVGRETSTVP